MTKSVGLFNILKLTRESTRDKNGTSLC